MAFDATWLASPGTNSFNDAGNWSGGAVPTGIATFGASNTTTVAVGAPTTLGELLFAAAAPAYTLNVSANVTLNGGGIVSSTANVPTINVTGGASLATTSTSGGVHVNLNGGGLRFGQNSNNPGLALSLGANGGTLDTSGNIVTVSSPINGIGALVKQGSGTLRLTGTNSYVGGTTVSEGVLDGSTSSIQGNIVNNATVSFTSEIPGEGTYSGVMSGTGKLVVSSFNVQVVNLTGNNTYSGGTTVSSGGVVTFSTASNFGTGPISLVNGGRLTWAKGSTVDISSQLGPLEGSGGGLNTNGNNVTLASAISGSGELSVSGPGTLTLAAANIHSGGTTVYSGTLAVSSDANLGAATGGLRIFNGTLRTTASFSSARDIGLGNLFSADLGTDTIETDAGTTLTLTGAVSAFTNAFELKKAGAGILVLAGDTDLTGGGATVAEGTLKLGNAASLGFLRLAGGTLDLNGNAASVQGILSTGGTANGGSLVVIENATFGSLAGTAGLVVQAAVTLLPSNTYSGGTTVQSGTLSISSDAALGAAGGGLAINNFAILSTGASFSTGRGISLGSGGIFAPNAGTTLTLTGTVGGSGTLQLAGPGNLVLAGSNTYTGGTIVNAGTLQVGNGGTSGTLGTGPIVDNGVLSINRSDAFSLGAVSGSGSLRQIGIGTTTLIGAMTYTGGTTVSAGTLKLGAGASLASGSALTLDGGSFSGATFDIGANSQTLGSVSGTGGSLLLGGGTLSSLSGLTFASANLFLGGFGSVQGTVDGAGRLIATGGTLVFTAAVDGSIASDIRVGAAAGSVLKFNSTVGSMTVHPTVTFNGGAGLLDLSSTTLANFHGVISGFAAGEGIKIANAASAELDGTGKILTVYDSLHSSLGALTFGNSYSGYSFTVTNNTVSVSSAGVDYSAAAGGVYTDLGAQFTKFAPAGQGWSSNVTPVATEQLSGVQNVKGSSFADLLVGGALSSTLAGGAGNDTYYVHNAGDQVIEAAGGGSDNVYSSVSWSMAAGQEIEYLRAYGVGATSGITFTGNELNDYLLGGSGNDVLNGGAGNDYLYGDAGADTMAGGVGDDIYYVDNAGDQVIEAVGSGTDHVFSTVSWSMAAGQEIESLRAYGAGATSGITLTGNELANYLLGGSGNDVLNGGAGIDTLSGGSGNDIYYVDNAGDQVIEAAGGGSDNVYSSVSWSMAAGQEIEYLRAYGVGATSGVTLGGNELNNYLIGGSGNDGLNGGAGNDYLFGGVGTDALAGGAGNDIYYVDNAGDKVVEAVGGGTDAVFSTVSWSMAAGQEIESLRADGAALTSGVAFTGNEFNNYLLGGSGSDVLNGGVGADTLSGGAGNDAYYVDSAGDQVIEAAGGGSDNVYSSVSWSMAAGQEIEYLRASGAGATSGVILGGNELNNYLVGGSGNDGLNGGAGNDYLFGGAGVDTLAGGAGNDIYYVDNAGDQVSEAAGGGTDTVFSTVSWSMAAGQEIESLRADGAGAASGIALGGNEFGNYLLGGSGGDVLNGGAGNDTLAGGAGNDIFRFDTTLGANNIDRISDFETGGDSIQLDHTIFAGLALGQLSASAFALDSATGAGPQIVYNHTTGALFFDSNGAAAGGATQFASVTGAPSLNASHFTVI